MADEKEIMKKEPEETPPAPAAAPEPAAEQVASGPEAAASGGNMAVDQTPKKKPAKKKSHKVRNIIIIVIVAVIAVLCIWAGVKFFGGGEDKGEIMHAYVDIGSITSTVSGEGLTRAKESASLTLTTSGVVQEVYVKEGDTVEAGQQLYRIKSETAEEAVETARKEVESCGKELQKLREAEANLTVRAPHGGRISLPEGGKIPKVGDDLSSGATLATLNDDSKMRLKQYYSYAYAQEIKVGQSASISIPATMATQSGKVSEIHMVERISPEGSKLFEVDFILDNPGTLTAEMDASATLTVGGETVYPYESGKLEYFQTTDIVTKVGGPVEQVNLRDYASVKAGAVLLVMGGDENDTAIFDMETRMKTAEKNLEEAQKALDLLNGVAPIAGTVMSVSIEPGQEVSTGTTVVVVADNSQIVLDANVDERNISYVKEGMMVDIDQWGTPCVGIVTSVSLTSKTENGVATFPAVISIDNPDGSVMPGTYATYNMVTSQSDDCMYLPIQAVKSVETPEGTRSVVFVHTDARPENAIDLEIPVDGVPETGYYAVPVTLGISDNQNVEILDGEAAGLEIGMEVFQQVMYTGMY